MGAPQTPNPVREQVAPGRSRSTDGLALPTMMNRETGQVKRIGELRPPVSLPARPAGGVAPHPRRRRISALMAGTTSCRSPMTAYVALVTIGASGSVLIARMFLALLQPAQCWIAPLMPHGM